MRGRSPVLVALLVVVGFCGGAQAKDEPVDALGLTVARSETGSERLVYESLDPDLLFPDLGGIDDPSLAGASVDLVSPVEGVVTISVPAGDPRWKRRRGLVDAYVYRVPASAEGAIRKIVLRRGGGLRVMARHTGLGLAVAQGRLGFRFRTGALRSCTLFSPDTVLVDEPGRFVAAAASGSSLADCDDASLGASAFCGNDIVEPGEACDRSDDASCPGRCRNTCTCDPEGRYCDVSTPCPPLFYFCELPPGVCASGLDAGICVSTLSACAQVLWPVCGCDGVTYGNDCVRRNAKAQKSHDGFCAACATSCDCESEPFTGDCALLCPSCGSYWLCDKGICVESCGMLTDKCEDR